MVEVFKTNVQELSLAKSITDILHQHFPCYEINFDLEDCDKILRVKAFRIDQHKIISILKSSGINCEVLDD